MGCKISGRLVMGKKIPDKIPIILLISLINPFLAPLIMKYDNKREINILKVS